MLALPTTGFSTRTIEAGCRARCGGRQGQRALLNAATALHISVCVRAMCAHCVGVIVGQGLVVAAFRLGSQRPMNRYVADISA